MGGLNLFFSVIFGGWILSSTVLLTIVGSLAIFWLDAHYLQLDLVVQLSQAQIWHNYLQIWRYLFWFPQRWLHLDNFHSSVQGLEHFHEVQLLIGAVVILWFITTIILLVLLIKHHLSKVLVMQQFFLGGLLWLPLVILACALIDFEDLFIGFHHLLFRNNYWIFDALKDPVINMLPDTFFWHCFIVAAVIFELLTLILWWTAKRKKKANPNAIS